MRIYLAGPDVFLPNATEMAEAKKAICARHGATGVFPTDIAEENKALAAEERFMRIYLGNEAHMRGCDAVVANLTPFRGPSADAGTVYELGFMRALGKRLAGYTNSAAGFRDRTLAFLGSAASQREDAEWVDAEGLHLEHFGLRDNLMIDGGIRAAGGLLVSRDVPPPRRWTDLEGFEACVISLMEPVKAM